MVSEKKNDESDKSYFTAFFHFMFDELDVFIIRVMAWGIILGLMFTVIDKIKFRF